MKLVLVTAGVVLLVAATVLALSQCESRTAAIQPLRVIIEISEADDPIITVEHLHAYRLQSQKSRASDSMIDMSLIGDGQFELLNVNIIEIESGGFDVVMTNSVPVSLLCRASVRGIELVNSETGSIQPNPCELPAGRHLLRIQMGD